jgi:hypothetical protein
MQLTNAMNVATVVIMRMTALATNVEVEVEGEGLGAGQGRVNARRAIHAAEAGAVEDVIVPGLAPMRKPDLDPCPEEGPNLVIVVPVLVSVVIVVPVRGEALPEMMTIRRNLNKTREVTGK